MIIIGGRAHTIDQIHEVAKLGYPYVEFSIYDPGQIERQLVELKRLKSNYGISYIAHFPNEGNPFDVKELSSVFAPKIKRLIDLSSKLDISKATIHFWIDRRWAGSELVSRKIDLLGEIVDHASREGIVLCIENLSERFDSFQAAFHAIPELRMTLDIGHAQLLSRQNTSMDFIRHVFEQIAHVHVHDNKGGTSVKDDLHLPLGDGIVDYPGILTLLKDRGYASTITMEVKPCAMPRTKEVLEQYIL